VALASRLQNAAGETLKGGVRRDACTENPRKKNGAAHPPGVSGSVNG